MSCAVKRSPSSRVITSTPLTRPRICGSAVLACIGALVIGSASPAAAATFYVDRANPSCTSSGPNAGSELTPYCTITTAVNQRGVAGNTIIVKPGIYREQVSLTSGAAGSPLILQAAGPGVIVDGSDDYTTASQWTLLSGNVWLASTVTWDPLQVFLDGARTDSSVVDPAALPARSYRWVSGVGLYVNAGGGNPATHQAFIGRRRFGFTLPARSFVTIDGFEVTRTEDRGINMSAGCTNITISRNKISFTNKMGIQAVGGSAIVISSNIVSDANDHGIALISGVTGSTIEDNECFRNALPTARASNGIHLFGCPNNTIRRNNVHDNQDSGIHIQSGSNNCILYLNRSWNNGDHGFDHLIATGTIHVGDVAYGNVRDGFSIEGTSTGTQVHNCIAVNNGVTTSEGNLFVDAASVTGFVSNYNVFWNSAGQPPVKWINQLYPSVAAYVAVSGQDMQTLQADPRFVNAAAGDFHLLPGSPAIDNGNSGAPNWPALDGDGLTRFDVIGIANTGIGSVTYSDRGAFELHVINQAPNGVINTPIGNPTIVAGQNVSFTGTASDPDNTTPLAFLWDFGGGAANFTGEDPGAVVFNTPGRYVVTFTVTDALGLADPTPDTRVVSVTAPTCTNLLANPSFETGTTGWKGVGATIAQVPGGFAGAFACRVTGPASLSSFYIEDSPQTIASSTAGVLYRFGASVRSALSRGRVKISVREYVGGTRIGEKESPQIILSPAWQRLEVAYSPLQPGSKIYFTLKDSPVGLSESFDLDDASICAGPPPAVGPHAALVVTPSAGTAPLPVTANASSSTVVGGSIVSYRFDFGDGTVVGPQPGATAAHTYAAGNWTCTVTVTDNANRTSTATAPISVAVPGVNQAPNGVIDSPSGAVAILAGQTVNFTGTGVDPDNNLPLEFLWNFGGGAANLIVEDPGAVAFNLPGTYTVTLTVRDARGLADPTPDTRVVTVTPPPPATCTANLIANPSFETGTSGWKGVGATIAQVPGGSVGAFACRVTGTASLSSFYMEDSPQTISSSTAGVVYRFAVSVRSDLGLGRVKISAREYVGGVRIGQNESPEVTLSPGWQRLEIAYSPLQPGSKIYFMMKDSPAAPSESFDVDDASICATAGISPAVMSEVEPELGAGTFYAPSVFPNPLVRQGILRFSTTHAGPLQVDLYDVAGRKLRTLFEDANAGAGPHLVPIDERMGLGSGLYFYSIHSVDGLKKGRFLITK